MFFPAAGLLFFSEDLPDDEEPGSDIQQDA